MKTEQSSGFCLLVSPVFNPGNNNLLMMVREQDPPLNLAMLAAWVRDKGFDVGILDCGIQAPTQERFRAYLLTCREEHRHQKIFVGFYVCTPTAFQCYELAGIVRELIPDSVILAGGPHASFMAEEVLTQSPVDFVVVGEGERTLEEIMSEKPPQEINGVAFRSPLAPGEVIFTPPRERFTDLDALPIPAYDLLEIHRYRPPVGAFKRLPSFLVNFSRGCVNYCFFCTKTLGTAHLQKSPLRMLEELRFLNERFGIVDFVLVDDTFTAQKSSVLEFCKLLEKSQMNLTWHCYTRVDHVDPEMLRVMKQAGCHQLMFGIESFDDNILTLIRKGTTVAQGEEAIRMTKDAGIAVRLSMMVGNIGDSPSSLKRSIRRIRRIKPDYINVLIATPGPGTPFFMWAEQEARFITKDWAKYTGSTATVRLDSITEKEIYKYYRKFWIDFYFHPQTVFKHLRKLSSRVAWYNFFEAVRRVIRFVFSKSR